MQRITDRERKMQENGAAIRAQANSINKVTRNIIKCGFIVFGIFVGACTLAAMYGISVMLGLIK